MHILAALGEIREIHFGSGRDRFDGNLETHYHFICRVCSEISDVPMPARMELEAAAASACDHDIESHAVEFYGVCDRCRNNGQSGS